MVYSNLKLRANTILYYLSRSFIIIFDFDSAAGNAKASPFTLNYK